MIGLRSVVAILIVMIIVPVFSDADAHSLFNSEEEIYGGYRVQVATIPEFPEVGQPSTILFRVTDLDYKEVDHFTLGARFYYNGQQVDAFPPENYQGGHMEKNYVWRTSGNHVVRVDLYDLGENSGVLTYTFNMGTQSPFGMIFFVAIITGAVTLFVVLVYIYFPKKLKQKLRFNS